MLPISVALTALPLPETFPLAHHLLFDPLAFSPMSSSDCSSSGTKELSPAVMPTVVIFDQNVEIQIVLTPVNEYISFFHPAIRVDLLNLLYTSTSTGAGNLRLTRAGL